MVDGPDIHDNTYHADRARAGWTGARTLSVLWAFVWRLALIWLLIVTLLLTVTFAAIGENAYQIEGPLWSNLTLFAAFCFVIFIAPIALAFKLAINKPYTGFKISLIGNQSAQLGPLTVGRAVRVGWSIAWRTVFWLFVITLPVVFLLMSAGLYEPEVEGNNVTFSSPWYVSIPVFLICVRAALRRRYNGYHFEIAET